MKSKTNNYIAQHNLEPVMKTMLNTLVYNKEKNPEIFMINYLASLLSEEEKLAEGIQVGPEKPVAVPIINFPADTDDKILKKTLQRDYWNQVKYLQTSHGYTLYDALKGGVKLLDTESLEIYKNFYYNYILEKHVAPAPRPEIQKYHTDDIHNPLLQSQNLFMTAVDFCCFELRRSLKSYPLLPTNEGHLVEIESKITNAINKLSNDELNQQLELNFQTICLASNKNKFLEIVKDYRITLQSNRVNDTKILFSQEDAEGNKFILIINDISHIRLISSNSKQNLTACYDKIQILHKYLDTQLEFDFHKDFGFINSEIDYMGNAISFTADVSMKGLAENNKELLAEVQKTFDNDNKVESDSIKLHLTKKLKDSEHDFLENVLEKLYNITFIEENSANENEVVVPKLSENMEELEKDEFRSSLYRAYENSYHLHKLTHFYPSDKTINSVYQCLVQGNNEVINFRQFGLLFHFFFMDYRKEMEESMLKTAMKTVIRNFEFSGFTKYLSHFSLENLKEFQIIIRRNIEGYDFNKNLTPSKKEEVNNILAQAIMKVEGADKETDQNNFYFENKFICVGLNKEDNFTMEFNLTSTENKTEEILRLINEFFHKYLLISVELEAQGNKWLGLPSLGYLTNDPKFLGTGLTFQMEILNPENETYLLSSTQKREGFVLSDSDSGEEQLITLSCNWNIISPLTKLFLTVADIFKTLKFKEI